ncbi:MAG TPA: hypothetical protein VF989_01275 [Polyangiaceae bacterium]
MGNPLNGQRRQASVLSGAKQCAPTRRGFLLGTLATGLAFGERAHALGRTPLGGVLRLSVPWATDKLDPHDLDDPGAALFAHAVFDSLYALDERGRVFPTLAENLPRKEGDGLVVALRPGLVSGGGRPIEARDAIFSLERAAKFGALAPLEARALDRLRIRIGGTDAEPIARRLASPFSAVVPRGFSPLRPDGTGAFSARPGRGTLSLARNVNAARGPAFLEGISVSFAASLGAGLRAFEAGQSDVGWLGSGLHQRRKGARPFDAGSMGWAALRTGSGLGVWGAPGVAQRLADAIGADQLRHLGVRATHRASPVRWGGGPRALLVANNAPQLAAVAEVVAAAISGPRNEIAVRLVGAEELRASIASGRFALALDLIRSPGPAEPPATALLAAAGRAPSAGAAPRAEIRDITRTLTLGVLGELGIYGAIVEAVRGIDAWRLDGTWKA